MAIMKALFEKIYKRFDKIHYYVLPLAARNKQQT